MIPRHTSWTTLGLALALALALVLGHRASLKQGRADAVLDELSSLARANAAVDRDVLDVRAGLVRHFDALARDVRSLRGAADLAERSQGQGLVEAGALTELRLLQADVDRKESSLEQLKTNTALFWNSSRRLPVALADLRTADEKAAAAFTQLAIEGARLGVSSGKELDERLGKIIDALEKTPPPADDAKKTVLASATGHARSILEHRRRLDELTASIFRSPAGARIAALRTAFERSRERALVVSTAAKTSAIVVGMLLFLTLIDLVRVRRAAARPGMPGPGTAR